MFFLLYRHNDDGVFDDCPKTSDHFPKISKIVPKANERFRTFSEHLSEDYRRLPKIADDDRRRSEDVSIIHLQI